MAKFKVEKLKRKMLVLTPELRSYTLEGSLSSPFGKGN